MIKNKTTQIVYQTVYCTLGLIGIFASFGIFDDYTNFRWDFYVYFTNISNFFCIGIMLAELINTIKRTSDDYVKTFPILKFIGMVCILATFLVFNFMLAKTREPQLNWRIVSILFHVLLPIMYIFDWFLFYERCKTKWYYPIISLSFPIAYIIFIFIQAVILNFDSSILLPNSTTPLIYPYFFLNIETQGVSGVLTWIGILGVAFVVIGFVFYGLDKLLKSKK